MEYLGEKVAYLKGLAAGLKIDAEKDEGRLLMAILDVLGSMSENIAEIESDLTDLSELVEEIDEDLAFVEEDLYDDCEDDAYGEDDDIDFYEIECPNCNEKIYLDEEMIANDDEVVCPNCKEEIEIDMDFACDADCDCHEHDEEE